MGRAGLLAAVLGLVVGAAGRAKADLTISASVTFDATTGLYDYTYSLDVLPTETVNSFGIRVSDIPVQACVYSSGPVVFRSRRMARSTRG